MEALGIQDLTPVQGRVFRSALGLSLLAHVSAVSWWWTQMRIDDTAAPARPVLHAVLRTVSEPLPIIPPKAPIPEPALQRTPAVKRSADVPAETLRPPVADKTPVLVDPNPTAASAEPAPGTSAPSTSSRRQIEDMIFSARREVGKIDRELRQSSPDRTGLMPAPDNSPGSKLAQGIASAGVEKGTSMHEVVLGDGRRYTKVVTSSGTYCVWSRDAKPSVVTATVFDTMTRTTNCPE